MTTNQTLSPQVLIVGAGPTGLTLACELSRRGVPYRLIEAQPKPQVGSRGKGLQPRSLEALDDIGIGQQVIANGRFAMPMRMFGPNGESRLGGAEPEHLRDRPDIPYTTSLITPEYRTEEALRTRVAELGGIVEFGSTLAGFEQASDHVTATIVRGDVAETITTQWLVGCDGGHSLVRKLTGIPFVGETTEDVRMMVADVDLDGLERDEWRLWMNGPDMFTLCPLPSTDRFQFQSSLGAQEDPSLDVDGLRALLETRTGRTDIDIRSVEWSSVWRLNVRLADRYRDRRVLLAGDAAHVHAPFGGQGMNTGIQDAYNLGWKLAAVTNGVPATLLDTYESERRPIAADVIAMSNELFGQTRDGNDEWLLKRGRRTIQLGVSYRGSPLARHDRSDDAELLAGDRAPDATDLLTIDGSPRLFELTRGTHFTMLCFGPAQPVDTGQYQLNALRVVERAEHPGDVVDSAGHLASAYCATDSTIALIRPDGYIAVISDRGDASMVSNYFATIS